MWQRCWHQFCINSSFSFSSALLNCRWSLASFLTLSADDLFLCFESIYDASFIVHHPFGCFLCWSLYNLRFLFFDWSVKCASHLKTYKTVMEYKIWMASKWENASGTFYVVAVASFLLRHLLPLPPSLNYYFFLPAVKLMMLLCSF